MYKLNEHYQVVEELELNQPPRGPVTLTIRWLPIQHDVASRIINEIKAAMEYEDLPPPVAMMME